MTPQPWKAFVNDDKQLVLTCQTSGSIAGDTHEFIFVNASGNQVFRKTTGSGITMTDAGSSTTPGILTVDCTGGLDASALMVPGTFSWQLRRTNSGREDTLAFGPATIGSSLKNAV